MARMTDDQRDAFLRGRRYGILTTNGADGVPMPIPLWFDWDGGRARLFSAAGAAKLRRIAADPRVALLVPNNPDETERWVLIRGRAEVVDEDGMALARKLAERYWDLDDPAHARTLRDWESEEWVVVAITPESITSSPG
jgi:PPOX class probable F420-dependent enzyme